MPFKIYNLLKNCTGSVKCCRYDKLLCDCLGAWAICISLRIFVCQTSAEEVLSMSRNQNWSLLRQNNSKSIWRVSTFLDLKHIQMFKFNPQLRVGHRYHVIDYEHVNMLKIQGVWNSSDAFAVILLQQKPVLVSAYAQNFFSWISAKKTLQRNASCSAPKTVIWVTMVANERYLTYRQLCGKASMWIFMYCRCKNGPKLG